MKTEYFVCMLLSMILSVNCFASDDLPEAIAEGDKMRELAGKVEAVYTAMPLSGAEEVSLQLLRDGYRDLYRRFLRTTQEFKPDTPMIVLGKRAALECELASGEELDEAGHFLLTIQNEAIVIAGANDGGAYYGVKLFLDELSKAPVKTPDFVLLPAEAWRIDGRGPIKTRGFTYPVPEKTVVFIHVEGEATQWGRSHRVETEFSLSSTRQGPSHIEIEGLDSDHPGLPAEILIEINGVSIHRDVVDISKQHWTRRRFAIPEGTLRQGLNTVRITNVTDPSSIGAYYERWLAISSVSVNFEEIPSWTAERSLPPGLKQGGGIAFLGDSITHQCLYTRYIRLFYATRYPHAKIRIHNAGTGGNTLYRGGLRRFSRDVAERRPSIVAVMFGMNDAGRRPIADMGFDTYIDTYMGELLSRVREETDAGLYILTPSFYDKTAAQLAGRSIRPGYNETLIEYANELKAFGEKEEIPVIDLNAYMVRVAEALRVADPRAKLTYDGIHPDTQGHLAMAFTILEGFGVRGTVSSVAIDASEAEAETDFCRIRNLSVSENELEFYLLESALPFPYHDDVRPVLAVLPFGEKLNRQILSVSGLIGDNYELRIDDVKIGVFTGGSLASGVNLSEYTSAPQYRQAMNVLELNDRLAHLVKEYRDFRLLEERKGGRQPDGTYPEKLRRFVEGEWVTDEDAEEQFAARAAESPRLLRQIAGYEERIYAESKPKERYYRLIRIFNASSP